MSDIQATQLAVFVLALGVGMGGLVVFSWYLGDHPPPKRWRIGVDKHDDSSQ